MIRFVNIKTNEFFSFKDWDEIINKGGLKNCLPKHQWNDIWEEKAAVENIKLNFTCHSVHSIEESIIADTLFKS